MSTIYKFKREKSKDTYIVKAMFMMAVPSFVAAVPLVFLVFVIEIPARSGFKPV